MDIYEITAACCSVIPLEAGGLYQPDVIQEERIPLELLTRFGADVKQSPTFRVELSRASTEAHSAEAICGSKVPPRWLRRCGGHLLGGIRNMIHVWIHLWIQMGHGISWNIMESDVHGRLQELEDDSR